METEVKGAVHENDEVVLSSKRKTWTTHKMKEGADTRQCNHFDATKLTGSEQEITAVGSSAA